jgi:predicted nucleotidyltransferase
MLNDQLEILSNVAQKLENAGIAYMVSGSVAMSYYAQPRMTRDIDIVIELSLQDVEAFVALFQDGFYVDVEMIQDAIRQQRMFNLIHNEYAAKIDFVIRKETPYRRKEFSRRRRVILAGMEVWLVEVEDLILSKLAWAKDSHSEFQLKDVRNLIISSQQLDWEYLKFWAMELDISELLAEVKQS